MARDNETNDADATVILGAGIIGCATAHYLSSSGRTKPGSIHLVEASPELFASASGKAGGFLASDWFGPTTASLGELSFRLHKQLADEHDGYQQWGYSRSTGASLQEGYEFEGSNDEDWLSSGGSRAQTAAVHEFHSDETGPAWLKRRHGDRIDILGEGDTIAQVDPLRLSQFLLRQSKSQGVHLHHPAKAVKVSCNESGELSTIHLDKGSEGTLELPCRRLLITSGAWTPSVFKTLFPTSKLRLPISQLAGHSLVVRSPRWKREHESTGCYAIYTSVPGSFSPEIFSRVGEEIYIAGLNDPSLALPAVATGAKVDAESIAELKAVAERFLGGGADGSDLEVVREGLCFRPVTTRGVPVLCRVPDRSLGGDVTTARGGHGGVFIAAGHGPWGISQSLGTGKVMSEMIEGVELSASVGALGLR